MAWTKQQISTLNELQLQEEILVPLFQAMKYKDVHIHQGPSEVGKDIVMWKETDVSPRVDYAVVVKASKITGKVGGNAGLGVLLAQIQQCLGKVVMDHINNRATPNKASVRCVLKRSYQRSHRTHRSRFIGDKTKPHCSIHRRRKTMGTY